METMNETKVMTPEVFRMAGVEKNYRGNHFMWESGGSSGTIGKALLVCGRNYERLKPVRIKRKGHLACDNHALFLVKPGYKLVYVSNYAGEYVEIFEIGGYTKEYETIFATGKLLYKYSKKEWYPSVPDEKILEVVDIAFEKANTYHCRRPMYYIE